MALMVIVASCENKPIDKSKYEIIAFKDAGLNTIVGTSEHNANEIKMFSTRAKHQDISEDVRAVLSVGKGQVVFADPETGEMSVFNLKGKVPEMKDGQPANIYFRLERKNGRIHKVEIDFIEMIAIVYQRGKTFRVKGLDHWGNNMIYEVKTGTVEENEVAVENWVSAPNEGEVVLHIIRMYKQKLGYLRLCSKNLDKDKVDNALSVFSNVADFFNFSNMAEVIKENGNMYVPVMDYDASNKFIVKGVIVVKTIQEKTDGETNGKYVITDFILGEE